MRRRKYYRRASNSLDSVVDDSAHVAARFGPLGALTVGAVGFTIFYALLPIALITLTDANKARLSGPMATGFANLLDQIMWQRFINPSQWAGIAILLACWTIAAWKVLAECEPTFVEISDTSWLAKMLARLMH